MKKAVIGGRNRVLATDHLVSIPGAGLLDDFPVHAPALASADLIIWAWYALDDRGRPAMDATLRGTETILARLSGLGVPMIMLSTDAVFSGFEGPYGESDVPDPRTDYGRIKLAQERLMTGCTRLRFTTFGPSYSPARPLLMEMIAGQSMRIDRPRQRFSPISTVSLNRTITEIFNKAAPPTLLHLTSEPVDKTTCLSLISRAMNVPLPEDRTTDLTPLDLSLSSTTHNFELDAEIGMAVAEWRRIEAFQGFNPPDSENYRPA